MREETSQTRCCQRDLEGLMGRRAADHEGFARSMWNPRAFGTRMNAIVRVTTPHYQMENVTGRNSATGFPELWLRDANACEQSFSFSVFVFFVLSFSLPLSVYFSYTLSLSLSTLGGSLGKFFRRRATRCKLPESHRKGAPALILFDGVFIDPVRSNRPEFLPPQLPVDHQPPR